MRSGEPLLHIVWVGRCDSQWIIGDSAPSRALLWFDVQGAACFDVPEGAAVKICHQLPQAGSVRSEMHRHSQMLAWVDVWNSTHTHL